LKTFLLGAGASKSYNQSPTGVKMPIARDFFQTFNSLNISSNPWVKIGDIVNYLRDNYGVSPTDFIYFNGDIEEIHSEIGEWLKQSILNVDDIDTILIHKLYMQLLFLFSSVINEIQNGPISKPHINIAKILTPDDCVITYNWDTLMDRALNSTTKWKTDTGYLVKPKLIYKNRWESPVNYQEEFNDSPLLIKLHGSTNWLTSYMIIEEGEFTLTQENSSDVFYVYESTCEPYNTYDGRYMDGYQPFSYGYYPVNVPDKGKSVKEGYALIRMISRDPFTKKGGAGDSGLVSMPLIIPPVKNKAYFLFGGLFQRLWQYAEEALSRAEHIIVIGYSFPNTDVQSSLLFKNAFTKRKTYPYVTILDPCPDRIYEKFKFDFGIPDTHLSIFKEYFSENTPIEKLLSKTS